MRPGHGGWISLPLTLSLGGGCGTQGSGRRLGRSLAQHTHVRLPPDGHLQAINRERMAHTPARLSADKCWWL